MATSPVLAFDANGDTFFVFSDAEPDAAPQTQPPRRAARAKPPAVYTFPVRSKGHTALGSPTPTQPAPGDAGSLADADSHLAVGGKSDERSCLVSADGTADDLVATVSLRDGGKLRTAAKDVFCGRSTSFDVRPDRLPRDQSLPERSASSLSQPLPSTSSAGAPLASGQLHRSSVPLPSSLARGSGARSSGGGAAPASVHGQAPLQHPHHHASWHNCEWWRSFSSSRLNELAAEPEPDPRSREMRQVPYVGGAAPMCALVHGAEEPR